MLDSSVHGKVHGELSADELTFLDQTLSEHSGLPAMVCLHHHPVDIGSDWMNQIGLKNREAIWQVIDRHTNVRCVLWGHIHQELQQQRNGVQLMASPSTCIQFTRGSTDFAVEPLAPGYRWFELDPSGTSPQKSAAQSSSGSTWMKVAPTTSRSRCPYIFPMADLHAGL